MNLRFETKSAIFKILEGLEFESVGKWLFFSVIIGIVAGLGAILFSYLLHLCIEYFLVGFASFNPPDPYNTSVPVHYSRWALAIIPALGGILSGILVYTFAPEAEGHGTDAMVESFHRGRGIIRRRVPFIKTIASVLTIGSGGSAGKEGPIAQIGAGFGSYLGTLLRLSDRDRRLLLLSGAAGGLGAIFKAPLGSALFVNEVLYRDTEIEYEGIIPSILSSIVSYSVFTSLYGVEPLFRTPRLTFSHPAELLMYGAFGVLCAGIGYGYIYIFYGMRDYFFNRIKIDNRLKPAVGGILIGMMALFLPQVLGGGYGWIQMAIDGKLAIGFMFILAIAKIFATSFTISSGGSGGVFAPSLFIGAMLGGFFGGVVSKIFPELVLQPNAFVMVGMGGFFAGVAKVPIASLIMVSEMTGSYGLLVPMMLVSTISYLFLQRASLYEKQVRTRIDSPAHQGDFIIDVLKDIRVADALPKDRKPVLIPEDLHFRDILKYVSETNFSNFPVVNKEGVFTGVISLNDIRRVIFEDELSDLVIAKDIATPNMVTVSLDEDLSVALKKFAIGNVDELPVVEHINDGKVIGILSRSDILAAYHRAFSGLKGRAA